MVASSEGKSADPLGWKGMPPELLLKPDFTEIKRRMTEQYGSKRGATQDFNQLRDLLDKPSRHVWITLEDRYLWWCTVVDGATVNPDGESMKRGNFWLTCNRPWSNRSVDGKLLAMTDLPGTVTTVAGFKGTVCTPRAWQEILRIIRDEKDPDAHRQLRLVLPTGKRSRRLSKGYPRRTSNN